MLAIKHEYPSPDEEWTRLTSELIPGFNKSCNCWHCFSNLGRCASVGHVTSRKWYDSTWKRNTHVKICERDREYDVLSFGHGLHCLVQRLVAIVYVPIDRDKYPDATFGDLTVDHKNENHFDNDYR